MKQLEKIKNYFLKDKNHLGLGAVIFVLSWVYFLFRFENLWLGLLIGWLPASLIATFAVFLWESRRAFYIAIVFLILLGVAIALA